MNFKTLIFILVTFFWLIISVNYEQKKINFEKNYYLGIIAECQKQFFLRQAEKECAEINLSKAQKINSKQFTGFLTIIIFSGVFMMIFLINFIKIRIDLYRQQKNFIIQNNKHDVLCIEDENLTERCRSLRIFRTFGGLEKILDEEKKKKKYHDYLIFIIRKYVQLSEQLKCYQDKADVIKAQINKFYLLFREIKEQQERIYFKFSQIENISSNQKFQQLKKQSVNLKKIRDNYYLQSDKYHLMQERYYSLIKKNCQWQIKLQKIKEKMSISNQAS